MNNVFFLAAGFGKRMGFWTENVPKPLLKIDGITFLDYALFLSFQWGVKKAWINTHYLGNLIIDHLADFTAFPIKISHESDEILGTAGGLRTALSDEDYNEPILIFNPDTLLFPGTNFKIPRKMPPNSKIHLFLSEMSSGDQYTKISLKNNASIQFGEGNLYYIGLAMIDPSCLLYLEPNQFADLSSIFKSLAEKEEITGEIFQGYTLDLGEREKYESFKNQNVFGESKPEILNFVSKYLR